MICLIYTRQQNLRVFLFLGQGQGITFNAFQDECVGRGNLTPPTSLKGKEWVRYFNTAYKCRYSMPVTRPPQKLSLELSMWPLVWNIFTEYHLEKMIVLSLPGPSAVWYSAANDFTLQSTSQLSYCNSCRRCKSEWWLFPFCVWNRFWW